MPLMTYEEYSRIKHATPYTYKIERDDQYLFYFGERHSFDPQDPEWEELKKFWEEFLSSTNSGKRIVFVEGGKRPVLPNEETAIKQHGGMGMITYLANKSGVETFSPEPNRQEEKIYLKNLYGSDQVEYYYETRMKHQRLKMSPSADDNEIKMLARQISPTLNNGITNQIARACSEYRDMYIVEKIKEYWNEGFSIFIQFGASHAVMQELILREIL